MSPSPKVLFICKKLNIHYSGGYAAYGLLNSARFIANALNHCGIESEAVIVDDANGIDRVVHRYRPTHIVIHALWVTPAKFEELLRLYPNTQWIVRLHSKAPFLANEGIAMEWLRGYFKIIQEFPNLAVSCNNDDFNRELNVAIHGIDSVYLPNIYWPDPIHFEPLPPKPQDGALDIACFGALRPMKNQFQQALAAIMFAEREGSRLRFHINVDRVEQRGETVLKNLRWLFTDSPHQLVEHPWYSHEEFLSAIRGMDYGLQVSFTESFNIVTADFVKMMVPIVVSDEIDYVPWLFRANPNDAEDIVYRLQLLKFFGRLGPKLARYGLGKANHRALEVWLDYLRATNGHEGLADSTTAPF